MFNELVTKNDPVNQKTTTLFFVFMKRGQLLHYQVLVLDGRTFHQSLPVNFIVTANSTLQ